MIKNWKQNNFLSIIKIRKFDTLIPRKIKEKPTSRRFQDVDFFRQKSFFQHQKFFGHISDAPIQYCA